jgi:hypothetical protein
LLPRKCYLCDIILSRGVLGESRTGDHVIAGGDDG